MKLRPLRHTSEVVNPTNCQLDPPIVLARLGAGGKVGGLPLTPSTGSTNVLLVISVAHSSCRVPPISPASLVAALHFVKQE